MGIARASVSRWLEPLARGTYYLPMTAVPPRADRPGDRRTASEICLGVGLLFLIAVLGAWAARWLRSVPLDVSGTVPLPGVLHRIKDRDEIAYPGHVLLARILAASGGSPMVVGLQWLKAAAHARNPVDLDRAVRGLDAAWKRSRDPDAFARTLRRYVRPGEAMQLRLLEKYRVDP
jgi:hypothetical protein